MPRAIGTGINELNGRWHAFIAPDNQRRGSAVRRSPDFAAAEGREAFGLGGAGGRRTGFRFPADVGCHDSSCQNQARKAECQAFHGHVPVV